MAGPEVKVVVSAVVDGFDRAMKSVNQNLERARRRTDDAAASLKRFGDRMENIGGKLTVVSAAIAATAGGAFLLAKGTADSAREIQNLSRVANAGTTEFQRMAAGAETVGIGQEKLADILKDVNDRVGDFNATGGGPMADFFEKVAPKIGVTADQFARLSGPEALQLYVSSLEKAGLSQQEMTFYMEAMASDATALLPLLLNGGKAMDQYGDAAERYGRIMGPSAIATSNEFNASLKSLQDAFQGVKDRFAVTLMPVLTDLMNKITVDVIPVINSIVNKIGEWITSFQGLDPAVQATIGVIVGAFGVGGPVALAVAATAKALGGLLLFMGPAGLIALAVIGGIAAWQTWGDTITEIVDGLSAKLDTIADKALTALGLAEQSANIRSGASTGLMTGGGSPVSMFTGAIQGALFGGGGGGGSQSSGAALADGMIDGMGARMLEREEELRAIAGTPERIFREVNGIQSPSTVFNQLGQFLGLGMANGIAESTGLVAAAAANMGGKAVEQTENSVQGILSSMGELFQGSKEIALAQAAVSMWQGAAKALELPFPSNLFAFGKVLATGAQAIKGINSAKPGGAQGGSAGSAAAAGAGGAAMQPPTQNFVIDAPGMNIQSLVDSLNQATDMGYRIRVNAA